MAGTGGRSLRSTEEVPVMGMVGREAVIWLLVINENCSRKGETGGTKMRGAKPFSISKRWVYQAYQKIRSDKESEGVDAVSLKEFDQSHGDRLYKIWNQMSSGSYMPPMVKLVEIPKKGGGVRPLGIPPVGDRIAQTMVRGLLEPVLEPLFHKLLW